ncbi:hypothetical protein TNCV_3639371 [Trichonephila clavipes]|nr:hypothetical protein TNCV_3639371 [Trichonephila clavipes]
MHGRQFLAFLRKDLCTWHVDRSWRRSIARLITKKEMQVEAYKIVRSLLVETDEAAFDIMLKEALKMFDEKEEMKEFKMYFEQTYSKRSMGILSQEVVWNKYQHAY